MKKDDNTSSLPKATWQDRIPTNAIRLIVSQYDGEASLDYDGNLY